MENQYTFKDYIGQDIYLTFNHELFSTDPKHVLIVPIYQGQLLFTCHKTRGWELPGGKVENNESPAQAAIRETWEETGAFISNPRQIGEYHLVNQTKVLFHKAIYLAEIDRIGELPQGFETNGRALFPFNVDTSASQFSPFVQDKVFAYIKEFLRTQTALGS